MEKDELTELAYRLELDMLNMYNSPILSGIELQKAMGYRTIDACRQAIARKTIPVRVFIIPNRRGSHALVKDIAHWLAQESLRGSKKETN
jgi:hypothetical protein